MKPKQVMVGGLWRTARPLARGESFRPGDELRMREGRNVYRYVCDDGGDAVLRNVRRPAIFEVWDPEALERDFLLVEPE